MAIRSRKLVGVRLTPLILSGVPPRFKSGVRSCIVALEASPQEKDRFQNILRNAARPDDDDVEGLGTLLHTII